MAKYVLEHNRNSLENVVFELEFPMARSISLSEFSEPLKKIRNNVKSELHFQHKEYYKPNVLYISFMWIPSNN